MRVHYMVGALLTAALITGCQTPQEDPVQDPLAGLAAFQGLTVRGIVVERESPTGTKEPLSTDAADRILRNLPIQVGQPFRVQDMRAAGDTLWIEWHIVPRFEGQAVEGGMTFYVVITHEDLPFDRTEFRGLDHFSRAHAELLGTG